MHRGNLEDFQLPREPGFGLRNLESPARVQPLLLRFLWPERPKLPPAALLQPGPRRAVAAALREACSPRAPGGEEVGAQRARSGPSQASRSAAPAARGLSRLESSTLSTGNPAWVVTRPRSVTLAAQTNFFQQPLMVITVIEAAIYL